MKYKKQKGVRKINIISIALRDGHLTAGSVRQARHRPLIPEKTKLPVIAT